jgi:hypothetical protein
MAKSVRTPEQTRKEAVKMLKRGKTSREVAKQLRQPVQRVAAWKAWITMGKY